MRGILAAALSASLAACSTTTVAPEQPQSAEREPSAAVLETFDALDGPDCGAHLKRARRLAAARGFADEPRYTQVVFLWQMANCAYELDDFEASFEYADRATRIDPEVVWPQVLRLYFGSSVDRLDASLDALTVLSRIAPEEVRELELDYLTRLLADARDLDENGDAALAAYEAIVRAEYSPAPPYFGDFLRLRHARLLLERGRVEEARSLLLNIVDIESVVEMRIDRLFDPLRSDPAFEARLDVLAAAERDVARSRVVMNANPAMMEAVYHHAGVLETAQRDAEALAVIDAALERHARDPASFSDADEYRNWVLNLRGYLLYDLGRADEGRAALREAAGLLERGHENVSNIINFIGYLIDEGRAAEALALIPRIGKPSPYGRAWIESNRSCAGAQLKDEKLRRRGLEYLADHEPDNPSALSQALLCSNDLDGAAALMIRRLADRKTRTGALFALQVVQDDDADPLPFRKLLRERFAALRGRADVRAAAEAVGRIETIPVDVDGGY